MARGELLGVVVALLPAVALAAEPRPSPAWVERVREAVRATGAEAVIVGRKRVALTEVSERTVPLAAMSLISGLGAAPEATYGRILTKWVDVEGSPTIPVRLLLADDGLRVETGAPPKPARPVTPREELVRRWQLRPFEDDGAGWSDAMLLGVEASFPLLTADERRWLTGLGFVATPSDPTGHGAAGLYVAPGDGQPGTIRIYADQRTHDAETFAGCARRPLPVAALIVLHELGHALADTAQREARRRRVALFDRTKARSDALAADWDAFDAAKSALPSPTTDRRAHEAAVASLDAWYLRLKAEHAQLEVLRAAFDAADARVRALLAAAPVVTAYAALPGALDGPTPYGRTAPSESFAEAFALWHTDPDAFRLLWPEVAAWFEAGGHLDVIEATLAELDADPALGTP